MYFDNYRNIRWFENKFLNRTSIITFLQQHLWWMLLLFLVILQIPFLQADPDLYLSHSRDAHSDEGLNTIQIRNYVNFGYLNPWECDNLMKNPLFNLIMWLPFEVFGTRWIVARITVLSMVIGSLVVIGMNKQSRNWLLFIIPTVMLQFHVFQYSHFALAEMMAISFFILSMFMMVKMKAEKKYSNQLFLLVVGLLLMHFSWFTKIQFIYTELIVAVFIIILIIQHVRKRTWNLRQVIIFMVTGFLTTAILMGVYYFLWYKPFEEPFRFIMNNQTSNRFGFNEYFWNIVAENYQRYFSTQYVKPFWILFLVSLPLGILVWVKSSQPEFKAMMLFLSIWIIVELHKITIQHVPSRYLLSGYVAVLFWLGMTLYGFWNHYRSSHNSKGKVQGYLALLTVLVLTFTHVLTYRISYLRRTFQVMDVNLYMHQYAADNLVVIGPWSPTISWQSNIRSLPVWKDFLNDKKIKDTFHPDIVVTEPGEADSDGAFCADNFDIVNESDSVKKIWIGKWPVHIYWMKK